MYLKAVHLQLLLLWTLLYSIMLTQQRDFTVAILDYDNTYKSQHFLLIHMSMPVHNHRSVHYRTEAFIRRVEGRV